MEESSEDNQEFEMDHDGRELQMHQDTPVIETVAFSDEDVRRVLSQIKPDKSPGPDGIPELIPVPVKLSPAAYPAFEAAKQAVAGTTTLHHLNPDASSQLIFTTSASNRAVSTVLHQQVNGQLLLPAFFPQRLQPVHTRHSTFSRDSLAVHQITLSGPDTGLAF
ncbi:hypothetical protein SprV_0200968200 [Sparganum proliferum]